MKIQSLLPLLIKIVLLLSPGTSCIPWNATPAAVSPTPNPISHAINGKWVGRTSQKVDIQFIIADRKLIWLLTRFYLDVSASSPCGFDLTIVYDGPLSGENEVYITNSTFVLSPTYDNLTGTFTSDDTAVGNFVQEAIEQPCGAIHSKRTTVTWTANKQ